MTPLSDESARVRFVFWNWLASPERAATDPRAESGNYVSRLQLAATPMGISTKNLREQLDALQIAARGDRAAVQHALSWLREVCSHIEPNDGTVISYALRIAQPLPSQPLGVAPRPSWWAELKSQTSSSPLIALIAAQALEMKLGIFAESSTNRVRVETGHEEWFARHRLGDSLLAAATTSSGHAHDAQTVLARMAPLFVDELEQFIISSPRWVPCCHVLDKALRIEYPGLPGSHDAILATSRRVVLQRDHDGSFRFLARFRDRPPRSSAALRLARRFAKVSTDGNDHAEVADLFHSLVIDPAMPVRARRFSLWALAELHANHHTIGWLADATKGAINVGLQDPGVSDVAAALVDLGGGYLTWEVDPDGGIDFFRVEATTNGRDFTWPMTFDLYDLLADHVLPDPDMGDGALFSSPWERVPRTLAFSARRMLLELLIHPGLVRVKAASDALVSAGRVVCSAAGRTISGLLTAQGAEAAIPDHVAEIAVNALGYLRGDDPRVEILIGLANSNRSVDCRAAAVMSLGDVLYAQRRQSPERAPRGYSVGLEVIEASLRSGEVPIVQAAILKAEALRLHEFSSLIRQISRTGETDYQRSLARWCLATWDG